MGVSVLNATSPLGWCWATTYIAAPLPYFVKTTALITASFTGLLTLCSVLGNSLYILIYMKRSRLQSVSNMLLLNVSIIGMLLACVSQPLFVVRCFMEMYATYNCILWEIQHLSFLYLTCVYFLIIFLISVDRFLAIFAPLRYAIIFTKFKVNLCVIVAWCFSLVVASSIVFGYYIFYAVVCPLFIITTTLVFSIYFRILRQARFQRRKIQNQFAPGQVTGNAKNQFDLRTDLTSSRNKCKNRKAEKTVLSVVVLMLVTALPGIIFVIVVLTSGYDYKMAYLYGNLTETAVFLGATLSPFVYCWRNKEIRRAMLSNFSVQIDGCELTEQSGNS